MRRLEYQGSAQRSEEGSSPSFRTITFAGHTVTRRPLNWDEMDAAVKEFVRWEQCATSGSA